ncbi:hypothetical protein T440DRAFT_480047 [Plenodomus tracheiphilus IPT5]|uniref:Uncharacterized protein n=1 Tax=Plenodomus tracheiphilus IPT5 TaxID=1408161 RepID=A0A6A7B1Z8_9PLEO|nr:hypothetical protein T440DRAFT_480047 [Plenodomus tracheiphilus IPT5]
MARLSAEHYKSNPGTPRPERKSTNRFREIFKPRTSSSVSSSPNLLTKAQRTPSPSLSPSIKPGFDRIGILPSEQSSFETARRDRDTFRGLTLAEMLKNDMKGINVSVGMVTQGATRENPVKIEAQKATENSSSPFPGTTIHNTIEIGSSPPASPSRSFAMGNTDPAHAAEDPFTSCEDHESHNKSFASKIFDDKDSLSQGIREYVASKIAKAISEHDVKLAREQREAFDMRAQSSSKISFFKIALQVIDNVIGRDAGRINLWTSPRSIGPITINHTRAASFLQCSTIAVFVIAIIEAALSGPKTLLLTTWRCAVIFGVYAVIMKHFGWAQDVGQDALLAPVICGSQELYLWVEMVMGKMAGATKSELAPGNKTSE